MTIRLQLKLHPESRCDPIQTIKVEVQRLRPRRLIVRFIVEGDLKHLRYGHHVKRARRDELWKHSCFEAFLRVGGEPGYLEFNLSSGGWNCYQFDSYREGMREALIEQPLIELAEKTQPLEPGTRAHMTDLDTYDGFVAPFLILQAHLELGRRPELWLDQPWQMGLSAVIEERSGRMSYWALEHPPGRPDFHHADCFALELPPARPA